MCLSSLADGLLAGLKPDGTKHQTHLFPRRHLPPDSDDTDYWQLTDGHRWQAHRASKQPEMRIISMAGEELSTDVLSIMLTDTGRG